MRFIRTFGDQRRFWSAHYLLVVHAEGSEVPVLHCPSLDYVCGSKTGELTESLAAHDRPPGVGVGPRADSAVSADKEVHIVHLVERHSLAVIADGDRRT